VLSELSAFGGGEDTTSIAHSTLRLVNEAAEHSQLLRTLQGQANQKLAKWRQLRKQRQDLIKSHLRSLDQDLQ
jgi:RNA polymerase-interacting CarD/CdnL/TRCF family regulator